MEIRASVRRELLLILGCLALALIESTTSCRSRSDSGTVEPPATLSASLTPAISPSPTFTSSPLPTGTATPSPSPHPTETQSAASPTPSPTPSPTATPFPTATHQPPRPTPSPAVPTILSFTTDVEWANAGDTVTVMWASEGATRAVMTKLLPTGQLSSTYWDVATSGSMEVMIPAEESNWVSLMLYVENAAGKNAMATATVRLYCPWSWFFVPPPEEICPTEPLISAAAEQQFERGTMIWVGAEDAIYVVYRIGGVPAHWQRFQDQWDESQPAEDPALVPPEGLQQPIRGFGLIWRERSGVRDGLGWALEGEQAFTTIVQRTTRFKYNAWYLLARDDQVWYLGPEGSHWAKIVPEGFTLTP